MKFDRDRAADKFFNSISETYLQLLDEPLHGSLRFLYATLGSLSLFLSAALIVENVNFKVEIFAATPPGTQFILAIIMLFVASAFFGLLISLARTRHGPIRLYISGILLPSFAVTIIRATWSIDIG